MNPSIKTPNRKDAASGFTLLEVILGMFIASIVLTGVYQVAVGCLKLSQKVTERQQGEMHLHALLGVLRRNIEDIPGNSKISMEPPEGAGGSLRSEIVLEDYPLAFTWAGVAAGSKRTLLISEKDPRGGTQIRIVYLNADEAEAHAENPTVPDDALSMVLIDGLKAVNWRFYNIRTEEWEEDWVRPNERPSLVEMNIEFYDDSDPLRSVFWIPVVVNPETIVRGVQGGATPRGGVQAPTRGDARPVLPRGGGGGDQVRPPTPRPGGR